MCDNTISLKPPPTVHTYMYTHIYIYYKYIYICICYYLPSGEKYRISPAIHPSPTPRACAASKSSNAVRLAMGTSLFRSPLATDRRFSPTPPGWLGSDARIPVAPLSSKFEPSWLVFVQMVGSGWRHGQEAPHLYVRFQPTKHYHVLQEGTILFKGIFICQPLKFKWPVTF